MFYKGYVIGASFSRGLGLHFYDRVKRNKKCNYKDCNKRPTFNFPNNPPHYCMKHKKDGMINVKDPLCKDCSKIACFNYKDLKVGLYCYDHSKEYMINISKFRTFVNPANEIFYTQNTFYDTKLRPNVYENTLHKKRWGLQNNFL